ncbi:3-oxo-5-alpha-steroid 4-dehydrogenase 1-like isoform X2 [Ruditapes philippinarum]|uniref:3-oxo-5-alpha-steroid 4-dehydrogenase 1-like isoform X2 n=1 Tax=Ruditapes philippinarum TaxID=129788 RepID=UPI00295ACE41|nr:3-oxo-5-alpha-steroid 4-dehydrogenase 1-like isoform X2 [Ruditapes philippinarum]
MDLHTVYLISGIYLITAILLLIFLVFIKPAAYGKYLENTGGLAVNGKIAWFIQELPSLVIPLWFLFSNTPKEIKLPNVLLLCLIIVHYIHRACIYPFLIRGGKPFPIEAFLFAVVFCTVNGYMQSYHILYYADYGENWFNKPHFLFGGMFTYVSGANFFGEMLEWTGFALAAWSIPSLAFTVFTCCNLGPRALHHHRYYKEKFEDYPKTRKALIPFIL